MIARAIYYLGKATVLICDGQCDKAWGINCRPRIQLSDDEDDYEFLADDELDIAPTDPGTYEGGDGKPMGAAFRLNKWCARECERSSVIVAFDLPDFSRRVGNKREPER